MPVNIPITDILGQIPIFKTLDPAMHPQIVAKIQLKTYLKDQVFFHEGDAGDALYIIKNGSVLVYHEPKELGLPEQHMAGLKENDFFGEMALVSNDPRNASCRALSDCEVFRLGKEDFDVLIAENPEMANRISTTYFDRFKKNQ